MQQKPWMKRDKKQGFDHDRMYRQNKSKTSSMDEQVLDEKR